MNVTFIITICLISRISTTQSNFPKMDHCLEPIVANVQIKAFKYLPDDKTMDLYPQLISCELFATTTLVK